MANWQGFCIFFGGVMRLISANHKPLKSRRVHVVFEGLQQGSAEAKKLKAAPSINFFKP